VKRRTAYALKLLASVGLTAILLRQVNWAQLRQVLVAADPVLVLIGLGITCVNVPVGVARWWLLLRPLTQRPAYASLLRYSLIGNFFNVLVPGGVAGDIIRGLETRKLGLNTDEALGAVITDRVVALVGLVVVAASGMLFCWRQVLAAGLAVHLGAAAAVVLGLTAALFSRRLGRAFTRFAGPLRIEARVGGVLASLARYRREFPRTLLAATIAGLASHGLMIASIYVLARALGSGTPDFGYFLVFVPVIALLTALPVTVGGLGIRDAGFVLLFPLVGMEKAHALGTSFLFFVAVLLTALMGGVAYLVPGGAEAPAAEPITEGSKAGTS
jgi:uncharacterized protein (TIRG00374 family)